jgi:hypothetical protein
MRMRFSVHTPRAGCCGRMSRSTLSCRFPNTLATSRLLVKALKTASVIARARIATGRQCHFQRPAHPCHALPCLALPCHAVPFGNGRGSVCQPVASKANPLWGFPLYLPSRRQRDAGHRHDQRQHSIIRCYGLHRPHICRVQFAIVQNRSPEQAAEQAAVSAYNARPAFGRKR